MTFTRTEQELSQITDEGLYEKLATAVLRDAEYDYRAMVHTGANAAGKTIKSPVDGILYRTDSEPPRIYVVHHTTTTNEDLRKKWMHDPTSVRPRRGGKPTAPKGDVLKTIAIVANERRKTANLRATLILTTNQEPDAELVREVATAGLNADIGIDIWPRSRLAHFLDTTAQGQWLRRQYLGAAAELLSRDLLLELSKASVTNHMPRDEAEAWVERDLDGALAAAAQRETTFLVAQSGFGKSVAVHKWLARHIARGGAGLVLQHEVVASALTITGAIDTALRQLCSTLGHGAGSDALALSSVEHPLYLIVEDINRSDQPALLAERIEGWTRIATESPSKPKWHYRLLCPLWPEVLTSMGERTRNAVSALALYGSSFTAREGRHAVQKRAALGGRSMSDMAADAVSTALGHDPLLIALHNSSKAAASNRVIGDFVEGVVARVALARQDYTAADYRESLRVFASAALQRRMLDPLWTDVRRWSEIDSEDLRRLTHLIHDGNLLHLSGPSTEQRIGYRHDRVRDLLLVDAADDLAAAETGSSVVLKEPYFAEVIGGLIARGQVGEGFVSRVRTDNPLALFHALRLLPDPTSGLYKHVVTAIEEWLSNPPTHERSNRYLRWEALAALAQTEGPDVIRLVRLFKERGWTAWQARFRNGDISGGIELCSTTKPGTDFDWRDIQIEHAMHKFGPKLVLKLDEVLRRDDLSAGTRVGTLRLAGHVADPSLGAAIEICWELDAERDQHLSDYLWACAQCCGTDAERYLGPVCAAWATLPSAKDDPKIRPTREELAANQVRWAFRKRVPKEAIRYFVKRAESEDLRWPITYMLEQIDDPVAVSFIVREMAEMERRIEGTDSFSPFTSMLPSHWRRHQEEGGVGMSETSRRPLQTLWTDPGTEKHLRKAALRLWAATHTAGDLALLRDPTQPADLSDNILHERILRSDRSAIPALLEKLKESKNPWGWWHMVRHVWSDELFGVLDAELDRRTKSITPEWQTGNDTDYATSGIIVRLSPDVGENLLAKHWAQLQYVSNFVQAALYLATPKLQNMVREAVAACSDPRRLLQYIGQHIGLKEKGHPGITREAQIAALAPYLAFLSRHEVMDLWEICNGYGWFVLRRSLLDPHLRAANGILYEDEAPTFAALDEMVEKKGVHWVDHWLERYAKTGATMDTIITRVGAWFAQRRSLGALQLVHQVLIHIGRRHDLAMLDLAPNAPDSCVDAIRSDAVFAVKRRSLH